MHTLTSAPVPLHPSRVAPTLPRTSGRSATGEVNPCRSSSRRAPRPPQSPGQSPARSPAPQGGWLGPAPLPDATTCARSGAAFVRRFTAKRAPRARPDPAPGPRGPAAKRAGQDQAGPRAPGPAVTWRRSDNFDSPRPTSDSAAALHCPRRASRGPHWLLEPLPFRLRRLPSSQPDPVRSTLPPASVRPPSPAPHPAITGQLPAREGAPNPERAIPRRRPRPRPLASGTAMGEGARRGGVVGGPWPRRPRTRR